MKRGTIVLIFVVLVVVGFFAIGKFTGKAVVDTSGGTLQFPGTADESASTCGNGVCDDGEQETCTEDCPVNAFIGGENLTNATIINQTNASCIGAECQVAPTEIDSGEIAEIEGTPEAFEPSQETASSQAEEIQEAESFSGGGETHTVCTIDGKCVLVAGGGGNECVTNSQCRNVAGVQSSPQVFAGGETSESVLKIILERLFGMRV